MNTDTGIITAVQGHAVHKATQAQPAQQVHRAAGDQEENPAQQVKEENAAHTGIQAQLVRLGQLVQRALRVL